MPLRLVMSALVCAGLAGLARGSNDDETEVPYRAYITTNDVYVRSGPGTNYYPVQRLKRGDVVEVYRHDPGGWYAIRPLNECFSWISAEFVEPREGNSAEVIGDRVVARVGSAFSDIRDVIQVRLDRGERIEVIEARRFGEGPAAKTWYKIRPPSGEFRWVSGKFVDREMPHDEPRERSEKNNLVIARHSRTTPDEVDESVDEPPRRRRDFADRRISADEDTEIARDDTDRDEADSPDARRTKRTALWMENDRADNRTADERGGDERTAGDRVVTDPRGDELPPAERRRPRKTKSTGFREVSEEEAAKRSSTSRRKGDAALEAELEEIDLALSAMVVRDMAEWNFAPMRTRTDALLASTETALDRGRVRLVQRKIERYDEIKGRHDTVASVQAKTDMRNRAITGGLTPRSSDVARRYDGVGRLAQIGPGQTSAAGFALLDSGGSVRYYVTPSPGVNLRPYIGREVGVNGTLGFMPDAQTQHVTAKRITVMDDRIVR